jgi:hypothetical protein
LADQHAVPFARKTAFFAIMLAFAVTNGYISTLIMLASVVEPTLEEDEIEVRFGFVSPRATRSRPADHLCTVCRLRRPASPSISPLVSRLDRCSASPSEGRFVAAIRSSDSRPRAIHNISIGSAGPTCMYHILAMHILTFKRMGLEGKARASQRHAQVPTPRTSRKERLAKTTETLDRSSVAIHTRRLMHAVCGPMTARRRAPVTPAALPSTAGLARALGGPTTITRTTGGPGSLGPGTMIRDPRRRRARTRSVVLVDGSSRGNPSELTRCLAGRPCWSQRRTTEGYLAAVVGPLSRRFSFRSPTVEREGRAAC